MYKGGALSLSLCMQHTYTTVSHSELGSNGDNKKQGIFKWPFAG
jgi:hypothetical protein